MRSITLIGAALLTRLVVAHADEGAVALSQECHCGCEVDGERNVCYVFAHGCTETERDDCGYDCCSEVWGFPW